MSGETGFETLNNQDDSNMMATPETTTAPSADSSAQAEGNTAVADTTKQPSETQAAQKEQTTDKQLTPSVDQLTDEQLEKLIQSVVSDPKSPFHQNPAWKRLIGQRDSYSKRFQGAFERLARINPQAAREYMLSEGYSDADAKLIFSQMGISGTAPTAQPDTQQVKENNETQDDDIDFLKMMKGLKIDPDQLDPEQRTGWKSVYRLVEKMVSDRTKPLQGFVKQSQEEKQTAQINEVRSDIEKDTQETMKLAKDKYGLDWESEVAPALAEYLEQHPKFVGTTNQLFRTVFFDKATELGKRVATAETAKLNDEKQRMNTETVGKPGGSASLPEGVGDNWLATWTHLGKK